MIIMQRDPLFPVGRSLEDDIITCENVVSNDVRTR